MRGWLNWAGNGPRTLLCLLLAGSGAARADNPPPQQDPAIRLQNEQRERQRQEQIEQAPPNIEVTQPTPAAGQDIPLDTPVEQVPENGPTFEVTQIELIGNTVLQQVEVDRITAPFLKQKLGVGRINLLMRRLTDALIKRGLITTRVYMGEQNLASGKLVLTLVPGKIQSLLINGKPPVLLAPKGQPTQNGGAITDIGTLWAFPAEPGQVLNLTDLEQGVDQINRLRRNQAEMQILPGQSPGDSIVNLNNKPGDHVFYTIGLDNYGSDATGVLRLKAGIEADNLIGLQEALSANFTGSTDSNALV
ncbi:ShlB/FhaC/HecB family hemolysin secretion/activation protein, partial [Andreprevotia chitinilytica]|uniref:ShlB/FhaC/HecB family hemolysin secretion/activation protein n=1 Tax=Andreprevotia chitinilytica TaxID=396808 RepID=UPI00146FD6CC